MELIKKNIHMNRQKGKVISQITLDDDYNVPDNRPDIGNIIQEKGDIQIDELKTTDDHVKIKGCLKFAVLYMSDLGDRALHSLEGKLPFDETINIEGVKDGDNISLSWELEDLTATLINSRKLSIKTVVTFMVLVEELYDEETAVDIHDDAAVQFRKKDLDILQMSVSKKDTYRVKDEIVLATNMPNIYDILWKSVQVRGIEIRTGDDKVSVKGEVHVFVLYAAEDEENHTQYVENTIPFSGFVDCGGCASDMIQDIKTTVGQIEVDAKPDYDGEQRIISVDVVIDLGIKLYEEERVEILEDLYAPNYKLVPETKPAVFENLLVKNVSKCRASERFKIKNNQARILQICHNEGTVKIDEMTVVENGIEVEGIISMQLLYITSDDSMPFYVVKGVVPFSQVVEAPGINEDCIYSITPDIEAISTTMIDSEEIDVNATIQINAIVMRRIHEQNLVAVAKEDLDLDALVDLPGIVGYIAGPEDTLWKIAKEHYTTIDEIMETNELASEEIKPGDKLILIKSVMPVMES